MSSITKSSLASAGQTLRGVVHARRTRRIFIGLLIALLVIGALGFFVAPPVIRHIAEQQLAKQLDRPVSIRRISLNPYTLDFEADGVHIGESPANLAKTPGASPDFVDVSRLVVRTSWSSVFRLAPVVNELKIDSPRINVVRFDGEHFNFSDLIAKFSKPSPTPSDKPARFSVSNIRLENGQITFDDRLLKAKHVIDRFALGIPFIATLPSATDIFVTPLLQARIDGSPLVVKGRTKPFAQSRESEIALTLDGLDVPQMASYAPASVPVAVKSGKLSTDLNVNFAISGDTPTIRIAGTADLADLAVIDKANAPLVAARALHVKIANAEPLRDIYHFDEVTLSNPDVHLARDPAGQLNVQKLAGPAPAKDAKEAQKAAPPLDLTIRHLAIDGGRIALDDQLLKTRAQGALTGLAVTLDGFSTLAKTPAKYTLKTAFDKGGALDASGNVTLAANAFLPRGRRRGEVLGRGGHVGRGHRPLEGPRADERDLRRQAAEGLPRMSVEARLWMALRDVEDPEIPISVVGMGLIVGLEFDDGIVDLKLTFTAMGCPAMDFIQDDIRDRLMQEPEVEEVRIEIVWDPVWTRKMIREEARETMRGLGIVA